MSEQYRGPKELSDDGTLCRNDVRMERNFWGKYVQHDRGRGGRIPRTFYQNVQVRPQTTEEKPRLLFNIGGDWRTK